MRLIVWILLGFMTLLTALSADSRQPIKIALLADPAQQITAHLASTALKRSGYRTKMIEIEAGLVTQSMLSGDIHVQPEWPSSDPELRKALNSGKLMDMGRRNSTNNSPEFRKILWKGMEKPWPGAVKLFRNFSYPSADQAQMMEQIAAGEPIKKVINDYLKANRDRLQKWKSVTGNWMKP